MKAVPETHQHGYISIENREQLLGITHGDFGIQIAPDGRVWICFNGISVLRFKPERLPLCNRTLHHNGGIYHCLREEGHEPNEHRFELPDVDTFLS